MEKPIEFLNDFSLSQISYEEIKKFKGGGEYRTIFIPSQKLKKMQRRILGFLKKLFPLITKNLYGLRKNGGCYVDHALAHSGNRWIFQFDIKNAFPSVDIKFLRRILERQIEEQPVDLILKITTHKQGLPQGAPTSPFLFYLFLLGSGLFRNLQHFSYERSFSCYVDDFVLSSNSLISESLQEQLLKIVERYGFVINQRKTTLHDCRHGAVIVAGISIDGTGKIRLPQKTIKRWRGLIFKAIYSNDLVLEKRIQGFISSLKPVYGKKIPSQISEPYNKLLSAKNN